MVREARNITIPGSRLISDLATCRTRSPPADEVFFVQNAGAPAAGTGLNKSSIIQKISLAEAEQVRKGTLAAAPVTVVDTANPQVINPNGVSSSIFTAALESVVG